MLVQFTGFWLEGVPSNQQRMATHTHTPCELSWLHGDFSAGRINFLPCLQAASDGAQGMKFVEYAEMYAGNTRLIEILGRVEEEVYKLGGAAPDFCAAYPKN